MSLFLVSIYRKRSVFISLGWDMLLCLFTMRAKCHAHSSLWLFQGFISAWPFNPESVHKCAIIGITTQKSQQNCFAIERRSFSSCLIMDQKQKFQGLRRNHFNLQPSDSVHHCSTQLGYWELRGELGPN